MQEMNHIREYFEGIEDTRHSGYVKYCLADILILVIGAVVCGITELCDMMVWKKLIFTEKSLE